MCCPARVTCNLGDHQRARNYTFVYLRRYLHRPTLSSAQLIEVWFASAAVWIDREWGRIS